MNKNLLVSIALLAMLTLASCGKTEETTVETPVMDAPVMDVPAAETPAMEAPAAE